MPQWASIRAHLEEVTDDLDRTDESAQVRFRDVIIQEGETMEVRVGRRTVSITLEGLHSEEDISLASFHVKACNRWESE